MWVEDARQLQAMDTNLGGKYALRNSIDATGTAAWHDDDGDTVREALSLSASAQMERYPSALQTARPNTASTAPSTAWITTFSA